MANGLNGLKFAALLTPQDILCQTPLRDRDQVLRELLRVLAYNRGIGNVEEAMAAVVAREAEMCTVVAPGVAMPHARLDALQTLIVGVATSREGVRFGPQDRDLAHLIILILTPKDQPGVFLQAVSALSKMLKDTADVPGVGGLRTAEEVWRFFERGGHVLPDYICAGDLMDPHVVTLQEHDTLERAIDLFARNNLAELPVVDREGDLVGVVSEDELLRICLPDYILWMEDLSPIIDFQPFAEVLRNEGKTWLTDIMSSDHVVLPVEAPAILVAKEMSKRHVRTVYVVRGSKLAGRVTIQDFVNKVLRE